MTGDRQEGAVDLDGGFTTATVRRQGATLSRTAHPRSEQVHGVLRHLAATVPGVCPEPIAIDPGSGLEVVSFVEGEVPSGGASPEYLWSESTVTDVARLLRRIHDATVGVGDAADGSWRSAAPESWPVEVVCHNDVAPWNTVFRGARPVAFIDWDTAAPGPRIWDVAYALWHFVPLYGDPGSDPFPPDAVGPRGRRIRLFCDAYGIGCGDELVTAVLRRQRAVLRTYRQRAAAGEPAFTRLVDLGADRGIQRQIAFVRRHAAALAQNT